MKIQILVTIGDHEYREHLSKVLVEKYTEVFDVGVCSEPEKLTEMLGKHRYDVVLCDMVMVEHIMALPVKLRVVLCDGTEGWDRQLSGVKKVQKYQRISKIISEIMERLAEVSAGSSFGGNRGHLTVCWSAAGGTGKTSVAMAYAAKRAAEGKKVAYMDLESFSSVPVYFKQPGKSISTVFEKLDSNVELLLQSIRQQDADTGIYYFWYPDNYDDINVLTQEDVCTLTDACIGSVDELVVDLSGSYDIKTKKLLETADTVLMVVGKTATAQAKHEQFRTQNNIYKEIVSKMILVSNGGTCAEERNAAGNVRLPVVQSENPAIVFKTLSGYGL